MLQHTLPVAAQKLTSLTHNHTIKAGIDLMVLRHMARQLRLHLLTMESVDKLQQPVIYELAERHNSIHRIVFYRPEALFTNETLSFVGFVSGRQATLDDAIDAELGQADKNMLVELMNIPGLLTYSSMELRPKHWYNLVMLHDLETKSDLKQIQLHQHAAYKLAPRAYDWIRIHSGIFPGGLAQNVPQIVRTKHYSFATEQYNFQMHEVVHPQPITQGAPHS
ncbi:hypothetical protein [Dictyobacter arantiisoli]|uniref:Uncharacterized protein n=1 Tax=Dictyobacter arantiisoli TaxID=2014874 RepID=A0A5A5T8W4_9CHLR|nr:hypothetical protein [Dictyobacter arantiisoli]GCF07429.1 hypothetical protein KDI_09930 [Dictyobacter arantiisoli]